MSHIDLHSEYNSSGESIHDLFGSAEEGFFVPLYQREYTWEEDNINQLFDDLVLGASELSRSENVTTFLGTTIFTTVTDKKQTVIPGQERAQPTAVQIVIDGQQRLSTLALLSIQLTTKLHSLLTRFSADLPFGALHDVGEQFIERLVRLHALVLGKGATPPLKPKIIRAHEDGWTYDGDDTAYRSPVSHYIATYIRTSDAPAALDALHSERGTRVRRNVELIDSWLDVVCDAHVAGTELYDQFPVGSRIVSERLQECVLGFTDPAVETVVAQREADRDRAEYSAAATYQLLLLTHYLLRRCGVNRLQPTREDWGFDMFQSLNATGTPLTVMETFLPQVMQAETSAGNDWQRTPSREFMDETQELFQATTTNEKKNRRTNELLRAFALCYDGKKLGNKFSEQRRWMTRSYEKNLTSLDDRRDFVRKLARTANFFFFAWYFEEMAHPSYINGLEDLKEEGRLASLLVRYLGDAHSRLSAPILARFYSQALEGEATFGEFVESIKACAAFFTLWRSANSTAGLDDIYRRYFKGSEALALDKHSWIGHPGPVTARTLKNYFREILKNKGIVDCETWVSASERFLLYTELKTICRFVLFVAGHNRIADAERPGLTTAGNRGSCKLLEFERWMSRDHRSLEHVAPRNPPSEHHWDLDIYGQDLVHQIGNLILLPVELNRLVDNKDWRVKYLYYSHVGVRKQAKLAELKEAARSAGIVLSKKATDKLSKAEYNCAVAPILTLGADGNWDASLVRERTQQIKKLAWEKLFDWLQP